MRRFHRICLVLLLLVAAVYVFNGGRWLVVDAPEKADAIVCLEGENQFRVQRGLELLRQGYAPRLVLDIERDERVFSISKAEIARQWIATLPPADAARIIVCPITALSTKAEEHDVDACVKPLGARSLIVATSDFHTRRAGLAFRHELPGYTISIAAARDPVEFGVPWWRERQWAKNFAAETAKLVWFEVVDRWR